MPDTDCPKCGGTGFIVAERGGLTGAERCDCGYSSRKQRIEDSSNIPPLYQNASVENFLLPTDNPGAMRALQSVMLQVRRYANDYPGTDKPGLLLIGDPGVGKTHLAVAALRILMSRGFEGVFTDYQNLLDRIRAGFDPSSGAGVTADLMVFSAHGLFGTSCITALTVQSTIGVRSAYPVSDVIVAETLQCLDADLRPSGIKIGMVGSKDNMFRICDYLQILKVKHSHGEGGSDIPIVLDPVLRSSSGSRGLAEDANFGGSI